MKFPFALLSQKISAWTAFSARTLFAVTIALAPLRARSILLQRPAPLIYKDFTDFLLFGSDISLVVLLILWGLSLLFARRPIKIGPKFISIPLLGLCLAGLFSIPSSLDGGLSLYHLLRLIALFLFYLYIVNEIHSPSLIIVSIALQLVLQAVVAVFQFLLQRSIGLQSLGEHILDPAVHGVSIVSTGTTRLLRAYGLTEHPNILGGCLAFSLILLLAAYLQAGRRTRWAVATVFLLGLPAWFVTFSRSAWLALIAGIGFLIASELAARGWNKLRSAFWLGLLAAFLIAPFAWTYRGYIGARLNFGNSFERIAIENQSIGERALLNDVAVHIFLKNPIRGVGLGASVLAVRNYYPDFPVSYVPPHFALLTAAMETGIFGAVSYLLLLLLPWLALAREKTNLTTKPFLIAASALLLALTLVGFFDVYTWLLLPGRLWQWLAWGVWSVAYDRKI